MSSDTRKRTEGIMIMSEEQWDEDFAPISKRLGVLKYLEHQVRVLKNEIKELEKESEND